MRYKGGAPRPRDGAKRSARGSRKPMRYMSRYRFIGIKSVCGCEYKNGESRMYQLRFDPSWSHQISALRDANSEDTNLIRFDNAFYRVCRAGSAQIMVQLLPDSGAATAALPLQIGTQDFYVSLIDGQSFGRYASTLDAMRLDAPTLNNAIRDVRTATGDRRFELQSLIVFCVAESIRSDQIAVQIESTIRASMGRLLGVAPSISVGAMLPQARAWGQSCDAIWAALSPEARAIFSKPVAARTPTERRFSERVNENTLDPALKMTARGVKVLKRPV